MLNKSLAISPPFRGTAFFAGLAALALAAGAVVTAGAKSTDKDGKSSKEYESVVGRRAFLGVNMQELTREIRDGLGLKTETGVLVNEVIEGSPAEKAGLEDGDVIVEFGGKKVESPGKLRDLVGEMKAGDKVKIKLIRDNRSKTIEVTLAEWDSPDVSRYWSDREGPFALRFADVMRPSRLGVRVTELNEDLAPYFGVKKEDGMLVLDVDEESTAQGMGIKAGDVITEVEGKKVASVDDIRGAVSDLDKGDKVKVTVVRKKKKTTLEGEIKERDRYWFGGRSWDRRGMRFDRMPEFRDDLRKELDELRKELDELRREFRKSKDT